MSDTDAVFLHSAALGAVASIPEDDARLASLLEQRRNLHAAIQHAGAQLEPIATARSREHLFAKERVLWCDSGWGPRALVCRPAGEPEQTAREWSRSLWARGVQTEETSRSTLAGTDVVVVPGRGALLGVGNASSRESVSALERFLNLEVRPVTLSDARFARLDMAVAVLDDGAAVMCRQAFDPRTYRELCGWLGDRIEVPLYDALEGGLRFVQVRQRVIMGHGAPLVHALLARRGLRVETMPLEQVQRLGRGPGCLVAKMHRLDQNQLARTVSA